MALGGGVYLYLRRSFTGVAESAKGKHFGKLLKTLFPAGLILPALLGFFSVSYQGCNHTTYAEIVQDRSYLLAKNHQQVAAIFFFILVSVLSWNLVAVLVLRSARRGKI